MRVVVQRVKQASVAVDGKIAGTIGKGLLVFAGIEERDEEADAVWLSQKITNLRIFDDENKIPNLSVKKIKGHILLVSQFTLHASTKKGNRPSYMKAAKGEKAKPLYEAFAKMLSSEIGHEIPTGVFGADMEVSLVNDGPVTILMDSRNRE